ncbi:MAG TPA: hypothetical protein VFA59_05180 [Vicinamibacterales bacterium]|nr:hypothetical protein [Vicinamibacterales bacterium]
MKRRTVLKGIAGAAASLPVLSRPALAQPGQLNGPAVLLLHEIAHTVLPSALGAARTRAVVERFVAWARGYQEGVALAHGYGHPRLQKSGPSPVPTYVAQLDALKDWSSLDLEGRRAALDAAFTKANIRNLPPRPMGQHVVADLMAFYFRSSEANDDCYKAAIGRETCRTIAVTVRKPDSRS